MLPQLTRFYGLRPWEVEQLTFAEQEEYVKHWRETVEAEQRAAAKRG